MRRLRLDRVVWLVSPQNPLKDAHETAPLAERMASARGYAQGPAMIVSDFETRAGVQWTVDTLRALIGAASGGAFRLADGVGQSGRLPPLARLDRHHADDAHGGGGPAGLDCWTAARPRPPQRFAGYRVSVGRGAAAADDGRPGLDLSDRAAEPPLLDSLRNCANTTADGVKFAGDLRPHLC